MEKKNEKKRQKIKETSNLKVIAHIYSEFPSKFGIPRQSGLVRDLRAEIVFEPEYRNPDAFRGLEGFSHIWLLWGFSENIRDSWSATVKPPRLNGLKRMGVFATRSPFRPNAIGLSSVKLDEFVVDEELGPILRISGSDLMDKTPIYDIKPYLSYTDSHPDATGGFADKLKEHELSVDFPLKWLKMIPKDRQDAVIGILSQDPRPSYQKKDPERIYGIEFSGLDIRFMVEEKRLLVCEIITITKK